MRLKVLSELRDEKVAEVVAEYLKQTYKIKTSTEHVEIRNSEKAYRPWRKQYDASSLLKLIRCGDEFVLVLTHRDIFVPGLNFVFGYAPGEVGIVSVYRLAPQSDSVSDRELFIRRIVKEAVHEVGHMLGLHHCSTPGCVMNFSNSIDEVDAKNETPCPKCMAKLISSKIL